MRESQNIEWKETWRDEYLTPQHSSCPFNPLIANAFFRAGEVEAWGRGMQQIIRACRDAGTPKPNVSYDPSDLWLEFPFAPQYLKVLPAQGKPAEGADRGEKWGKKWGKKWGEKWGENMLVKRRLIVDAMRNDPRISISRLASDIGMGTTAIENHLKVMRDCGCIRHVGPAKGGHWEVLQ